MLALVWQKVCKKHKERDSINWISSLFHVMVLTSTASSFVDIVEVDKSLLEFLQILWTNLTSVNFYQQCLRHIIQKLYEPPKDSFISFFMLIIYQYKMFIFVIFQTIQSTQKTACVKIRWAILLTKVFLLVIGI